jgi:hypothetical protein
MLATRSWAWVKYLETLDEEELAAVKAAALAPITWTPTAVTYDLAA